MESRFQLLYSLGIGRVTGHRRVTGSHDGMRKHVEPLASSSHLASTSTRLGTRWSLESLCDGSRQLHGNEKVGWIDVVFAGLVDNPNVAFSTGLAIWQHLIDFTNLEVLLAAVFNAQCERPCRLLNSHGVQSRKRLIFNPHLPTPCASYQ